MSTSQRTAYRIAPLKDGTFGVEVTEPNAAPVMYTGFATEAEAVAWRDEKRGPPKTRQTTDMNQRAKSVLDRFTDD